MAVAGRGQPCSCRGSTPKRRVPPHAWPSRRAARRDGDGRHPSITWAQFRGTLLAGVWGLVAKSRACASCGHRAWRFTPPGRSRQSNRAPRARQAHSSSSSSEGTRGWPLLIGVLQWKLGSMSWNIDSSDLTQSDTLKPPSG